MTDTAKIEPALSAEEWADLRDPASRALLMRQLGFGTDAGAIAQTIAILNDALPDSDTRKITRAKLDELESIIESAYERTLDHEPAARAFLAALASYLPPDGPQVVASFPRRAHGTRRLE